VEFLVCEDGFLFASEDGTQLLLAKARENQIQHCNFFDNSTLRMYDAGGLEPAEREEITQHIKVCRITAQRILSFRRAEVLAAKIDALVSEFHQPEDLLLLLGSLLQAISDEETFLSALKLLNARGNMLLTNPWWVTSGLRTSANRLEIRMGNTPSA
jgi:hypothetical protein